MKLFSFCDVQLNNLMFEKLFSEVQLQCSHVRGIFAHLGYIEFFCLKIVKISLQIVFQGVLVTLHCVSMRSETFGMLEQRCFRILMQILNKNS